MSTPSDPDDETQRYVHPVSSNDPETQEQAVTGAGPTQQLPGSAQGSDETRPIDAVSGGPQQQVVPGGQDTLPPNLNVGGHAHRSVTGPMDPVDPYASGQKTKVAGWIIGGVILAGLIGLVVGVAWAAMSGKSTPTPTVSPTTIAPTTPTIEPTTPTYEPTTPTYEPTTPTVTPATQSPVTQTPVSEAPSAAATVSTQ